MVTKLYMVYYIMNKLVYTVITMAILVTTVIYLVSTKPTPTGESVKVKVTTAPEKQLVKPDDLIEEVILGSDDQPVIGDQNGHGPAMTII
jgi:hypothetical protein